MVTGVFAGNRLWALQGSNLRLPNPYRSQRVGGVLDLDF